MQRIFFMGRYPPLPSLIREGNFPFGLMYILYLITSIYLSLLFTPTKVVEISTLLVLNKMYFKL